MSMATLNPHSNTKHSKTERKKQRNNTVKQRDRQKPRRRGIKQKHEQNLKTLPDLRRSSNVGNADVGKHLAIAGSAAASEGKQRKAEGATREVSEKRGRDEHETKKGQKFILDQQQTPRSTAQRKPFTKKEAPLAARSSCRMVPRGTTDNSSKNERLKRRALNA